MKKFLYWCPRVLGVLFILFISIFALDVFDAGLDFWGTIVALFMHLIPSFALLITLAVAWKWEIVGGIGFLLLGAAYIFTMTGFPSSVYLVISGPAFLIGLLFILDARTKRKNVPV